MNEIYDLVIVGSGPAGLTAAIYAQRALLKTIVIEKNPMSGGQVLNTYEVDNYPGIPEENGFDLGQKMRVHADKLGTQFMTADVECIRNHEEHKEIVLINQPAILTKTVIVATGAHYRKIGVPGEEEFSGMGVSYCATCDGAFFRGRTVAVIGGGDVALEDAIFLARGSKKVYVIHRRDEFRGTKILQNKLLELPNVEIIWDTVVDKITGSEAVESIQIQNRKTGEAKELAVDGVFIAIGMVPDSEILSGIVDMTEGGYVRAQEEGVTSEPGIFVAGDIRTKELRQIVTAASDGANAVFAVEKYLVSL